jgi:hypothetical protein
MALGPGTPSLGSGLVTAACVTAILRMPGGAPRRLAPRLRNQPGHAGMLPRPECAGDRPRRRSRARRCGTRAPKRPPRRYGMFRPGDAQGRIADTPAPGRDPAKRNIVANVPRFHRFALRGRSVPMPSAGPSAFGWSDGAWAAVGRLGGPRGQPVTPAGEHDPGVRHRAAPARRGQAEQSSLPSANRVRQPAKPAPFRLPGARLALNFYLFCVIII